MMLTNITYLPLETRKSQQLILRYKIQLVLTIYFFIQSDPLGYFETITNVFYVTSANFLVIAVEQREHLRFQLNLCIVGDTVSIEKV